MRWQVWVTVIACALMITTSAQAQTATPSPTPTPNVVFVLTLAPRVNDLGTQEAPAQAVAFIYRADAGEVVIGIMLGALIFITWGTFIIWIILRSRSERSDRSATARSGDRRASPGR